MPRPDQFFEWQTLIERDPPMAVGSRERLLVLWGLFVLVCLVIVGRAVQLEMTQGAAFRAAAAQPGRQNEVLPAERGRILARDGTVLAADEHIVSLAVHYRYLENPPDTAWLRSQARNRLPRAQRGKADRLAEQSAAICRARDEIHRRLAERCELSPEEWQRRAGRIQRRVEAVAAHVNRARQDRLTRDKALEEACPAAPSNGWWRVVADLFAADDSRPAEPIIVAEQLAHHAIVDALPADVVRDIRADPARFTGIRLVERLRRAYPAGNLAANIVGHVGPADPHSAVDRQDASQNGPEPSRVTPSGAGAVPASATFVGRLGIERGCEAVLRGRAGVRTHLTDHRGQWVATQSSQASVPGGDVALSLDASVQQAAESLLDRALEGAVHGPNSSKPPAGGAVVVMNIASGELLAAASAPRFDPNLFTHGDDDQLTALLASPGHPLFDRATKMSLPPGSVFKIVTAVALVESQAISRDTPFACQGYLHEPDRLRCAVYRHSGVGHGEVRLSDALAQSCNVFFFHFAAEMGPGALVTWAERFGAGRRTGVDLPDEAAGQLGTPGSLPRVAGRAWQAGDTYGLAVGQGPLSATPLQVARWAALIANGGYLVTPRVTRGAAADTASAVPDGDRLPISAATLAVVREGMQRVVNDPSGSGYGTVRLTWPTIAGKTGTAEVGGDQPEHAWFAGYAPADDPKWAIVVVLEHGGNGATAAGPIARRMVQALHQAGYL